MTKTNKIKINALPRLKLLDTKLGWRQRNEVLSSFVQDYFSENTDVISVLEAGCGRKWHLDLGSIKFKLTGVDINRDALEFRINNEGDLDRVIVGDLCNIKQDQDEYDIIYCIDVIEHIKGAEQVIVNFFKWLRPKGLLILVFPDRDSVFGFITNSIPHWGHILYYKYILGYPNAGKHGFGPFPVYYDKIVSRRAIHEYCYSHDHRIVLEYGRPFNFIKLGWLGLGVKFFSKVLQCLSYGKLAGEHVTLVYVIQK